MPWDFEKASDDFGVAMTVTTLNYLYTRREKYEAIIRKILYKT